MEDKVDVKKELKKIEEKINTLKNKLTSNKIERKEEIKPQVQQFNTPIDQNPTAPKLEDLTNVYSNQSPSTFYQPTNLDKPPTLNPQQILTPLQQQ